jgi:3-methyladenine DNA glycosylase AlkD
MLTTAKNLLHSYANPKTAASHKNYFKDAKLESFIGVAAADMKKVAKQSLSLAFSDIKQLMVSPIHDERVLANIVLVMKYEKAVEGEKAKIFEFYIAHLKFIEDWANVDNSAPYIMGRHLLSKNKELLYNLARSERIWDRRIAIVSTWWFIRKGSCEDALAISEILLSDREDLIHKAVGWMLREVGKRDLLKLEEFLDQHHAKMARTTLRYAIERFPKEKRYYYLSL